MILAPLILRRYVLPLVIPNLMIHGCPTHALYNRYCQWQAIDQCNQMQRQVPHLGVRLCETNFDPNDADPKGMLCCRAKR